MKLREYKKFLKLVTSIMIIVMGVSPTFTLATEVEINKKALGSDAKSLGLEILKHNYESELNINELYPSNLDETDLGTISIDELKKLSNSSEELEATSLNNRNGLWEDANSDNPSLMGAAYKVVLDAANRARPEFTDDPVLNTTKNIYEKIDLINSGFVDCKSDKTISELDTVKHIPDYQNCDRSKYQSGECTVQHNYDATVLSHYAGPYNLDKCGDECIELWIGKVGDNYWKGNCTIYEQFTQVVVDNPAALTQATLVYAKWDDYMQVWIGEPGKEHKVWQGPNQNFPPETEGKCELSTSWKKDLNVDVTKYFKNIKPGSVVSFKIRVSVTGAGEGFGKVLINYDKSKAITKDEWQPISCLNNIKGVNDGLATGEYECKKMPVLDKNGCTIINGVTVCEDMLKTSPASGINQLCQEMTVKTDFNLYKGNLDCWIDPQGEKQCPGATGYPAADKCEELEKNSKCGFISSKCVEGAIGKESGECYLFTDTYDCGEDVVVTDKVVNNNYSCDGAISCMGSECLDYDALKDSSGSFGKAVGLLNTAQFMTQDMECDGVDENDNIIGDRDVICRIFSGKAGECKIAVGGVSDCCEKPSGVSLNDYMTMIMSIPKLDGAIMQLSDTNVIKGGYQVIREGVMASWDAVSKPFASYVENISGAVDYVTEAVNTFVDKLKAEIQKQIEKFIYEAIKESATEAVVEGGATTTASEAASEAAEQLMGYASAALSAVMMVYTIYVLAVAAIKLIWKCSDEEFNMNAQRVLKNCAYVGSYCKTKVLGACIEKRESYCCYNSPLSRIIQEQLRKKNQQMNLNFGNAKAPKCDGLLISEIENIDWDKIDLSEWLAILEQTGHLNDQTTIDLDKLTGKGSIYNTSGNRLNSQERAEKRYGDSNATEINKQIIDTIDLNTGSPASRRP